VRIRTIFGLGFAGGDAGADVDDGSGIAVSGGGTARAAVGALVGAAAGA